MINWFHWGDFQALYMLGAEPHPFFFLGGGGGHLVLAKLQWVFSFPIVWTKQLQLELEVIWFYQSSGAPQKEWFPQEMDATRVFLGPNPLWREVVIETTSLKKILIWNLVPQKVSSIFLQIENTRLLAARFLFSVLHPGRLTWNI